MDKGKRRYAKKFDIRMLEKSASGKRLIAEIGINHDGSPTVAAEMVRALARAGVDAIKLQYRNVDRMYPDPIGSVQELGDEMVGEELRRTFLNADEQIQLVALAQSLGLKVGVSFFNEADIADFGSAITKFDFFKVPSAELENADLINSLVTLDRLLFVSTGGHTEDQIVNALERIESFENWVPLHAVMNYPTENHNAQLGYISHLSTRWQRPVGYSSHDRDWEMCLFAASLGAEFIERHVTYSKSASGLDHSSSSEMPEMSKLSRLLRAFDTAKRCPVRRVPNQGELMNMQNLGRSYYARESMSVNELILASNFDYRAPRRGIGPREAEKIWGLPIAQSLPAGEALSRYHCHTESDTADHLFEWADGHSVGIPIRHKDWRVLSEMLPVHTYEFHLSFKDVRSGLSTAGLPDDCTYSIHLPDYVGPTELLNLYSEKPNVRYESRRTLAICMRFAQELQELSGASVPVVGSFSDGQGDSTEAFYEGQRDLVDECSRSSVLLVHQWLPPYAWYFGGSVPVKNFNSLEDLELCERYEIPLCLDTAHAALSVNAGLLQVADFLKMDQSRIAHSHIAGASGIDAEGIPLAEADENCLALVEWVLDMPVRKILERWQGHFSRGRGFLEDLAYLNKLA